MTKNTNPILYKIIMGKMPGPGYAAQHYADNKLTEFTKTVDVLGIQYSATLSESSDQDNVIHSFLIEYQEKMKEEEDK